MVAPGPARSTRRRPPMSGHLKGFAACGELSRLGGEAQSIERRGIDPFETNLVAYAREKNLLAPWIEHFDWRTANPVPAGWHGATGDQRLAARDEQGTGRRWGPGHGPARDREFWRKPAEKGEARREAIHIDTVAGANMQADDSRGRQTQDCRDLFDILAMRRIIAGGDVPALSSPQSGFRCGIEPCERITKSLRRQAARIEMNHQRTVRRHGFDHARKIRLADGGIERQNPVMNPWINRGAEFDNKCRFSGGQVARRWLV